MIGALVILGDLEPWSDRGVSWENSDGSLRRSKVNRRVPPGLVPRVLVRTTPVQGAKTSKSYPPRPLDPGCPQGWTRLSIHRGLRASASTVVNGW
jgi:hypothetical protein